MPLESLSRRDERVLALRAQALSGPRPTGGPFQLLRLLGALQLDTISVLARSHLLVLYARLGRLDRQRAEAALWCEPPRTFEYWAHEACILPIEHWPMYAFRRRERIARGRRWHRLENGERSLDAIRARLAEGACTASELGGAKGGGPWWDWTEEKIAVEWLLDTGEVVCTRRVGWRRVYELAEHAIPKALREIELDDHECRVALVVLAGRALGVATTGEIANFFRMRIAEVEAVISDTKLVPVSVEGSKTVHYADGEALSSLGAAPRSRTTLLSPFDSLLWDRGRAERLFGFVHRLEVYVPRAQRVHGYYAMPVLAGGKIVARVDPAREGKTLVARRVTIERASAVESVARALVEAAGWVGADNVVIEAVSNEVLRAPLLAALSRN